MLDALTYDGDPKPRTRGGFIARLKRWHLERRTTVALEQLSNAELKDLGVARCGIRGRARELLWLAGG